ncbi:hypothetical protein F2Q69_00034999 [Brassica cretica]|uniref:Uncharacterized protein n=1 Tax=Brassica cretica TaxID=69181 RepID=A0A8S9SLW6_BRACR|nr:hypothetical protein F2Q69_00034999 [Brassica cretica]
MFSSVSFPFTSSSSPSFQLIAPLIFKKLRQEEEEEEEQQDGLPRETCSESVAYWLKKLRLVEQTKQRRKNSGGGREDESIKHLAGKDITSFRSRELASKTIKEANMCEKALKVEFICGVTMSNRHSKPSFNSKKPQVNGAVDEEHG